MPYKATNRYLNQINLLLQRVYKVAQRKPEIRSFIDLKDKQKVAVLKEENQTTEEGIKKVHELERQRT